MPVGRRSAAGPQQGRRNRATGRAPAGRARPDGGGDLRAAAAGRHGRLGDTPGAVASTAPRALGSRPGPSRPTSSGRFPDGALGSPADEVRARRVADPAGLVQHRGRPARAAVPAAPSGHRSADRARRPGPALPDGAHRPGGLGRARDRDPRPGPRRLPPLPTEPAVPGASARAGARYARPHLLQVRGRESRRAATSRTRPSRRRGSTSRRASSASRPRPAPGSGGAPSRSPVRCSASRSRSTWSARATTRSRTGGS